MSAGLLSPYVPEPIVWRRGDGEALIADDNAPVRDAVVAQLGGAGCVCHTAASYGEGTTCSLGIRVAALRESEYNKTVRDTGPGVAAEDRG